MNSGRHGTSLSGPSAGPAELQCNLRLDLATLCRMGDYSFIGQSEEFFTAQTYSMAEYHPALVSWYATKFGYASQETPWILHACLYPDRLSAPPVWTICAITVGTTFSPLKLLSCFRIVQKIPQGCEGQECSCHGPRSEVLRRSPLEEPVTEHIARWMQAVDAMNWTLSGCHGPRSSHVTLPKPALYPIIRVLFAKTTGEDRLR